MIMNERIPKPKASESVDPKQNYDLDGVNDEEFGAPELTYNQVFSGERESPDSKNYISPSELEYEIDPDVPNLGSGDSIRLKPKAITPHKTLLAEIEEQQLLNERLNNKAEESEPTSESFLLSEQQRKDLRITLLALGLAVVPAAAAYKHFSKDEKAVEVSSSDATIPYNENYVIEKSNAFNEADESIKYNKAENVLEVKPAKQPEAVKEVRVAESSSFSKENVKLDTFEKEVAEHLASLKKEDIELTKKQASEKVDGHKDSKETFIKNNIEFEEWDSKTQTGVPPIVQQELKKIILGLCAQESKFDNDAISNKGAKGIMQIVPDTWIKYGGKPGGVRPLSEQVEIAGKLFSDIYKEINHHIGDESLRRLRSRYSNEASFERDLIVPLMINSYNTGSSRMAEAVKLYLANTPSKKIPTGKDLYVAIADYAKSSKKGVYLAGYGEQSREYVPKIYAQAEIFNTNELDKKRKRIKS